ncbi:uncharacterized protein KD926_000423 [Aspergillus affinis]|uniref:uncharacterized protein n=1 Tax=Aspergillus affinis TaxID=1070780 RepID=UPI0022FF117C|nr:uncharacterized protein KD926_000423 [Aspergillus affinis]KAI9044512.1 hypothetical protein KD926_000423 [Aspergillus affinis]
MYYLLNILDLSPSDELHINEWLHRSKHLSVSDFKCLEQPINELESHLTLRSYIVGYSVTLADIAMWGVLRGNQVMYDLRKNYVNIDRWFKFIEANNDWITSAVENLNSAAGQERITSNAAGVNHKTGFKNTITGMVTRIFQ